MCPPLGKLGGLVEGKMVCHCLLVETNDGLMLVDTGLGTGDIDDPKGRLGGGFVAVAGPVLRREETALAQIERLGFKARDVRHLIPTHLDLDHAGGLSDFPEATVHIYAKEHDAAITPRTLAEKERYRRAHFAHQPKWRVLETDGEAFFGFDSVRALGGTGEEVLLVPLTGHTRGHCGVAVRAGDGWRLHAGDAYFFHGEVHGEPRTSAWALTMFQRFAEIDRKTRLSNQARLRELSREHGSEVRVFSAHCPIELERERSAASTA